MIEDYFSNNSDKYLLLLCEMTVHFMNRTRISQPHNGDIISTQLWSFKS